MKSEYLIRIQLFNFDENCWDDVSYVVYDLNDLNARTFGYFIDRDVLDFTLYDGLFEDDLLYQLKYRFVIDEDYFSDDISTKTKFKMDELKVQLFYNPVQSLVSLNPRLEFSADITDIIYPVDTPGVETHINELSFDIGWEKDVFVYNPLISGIDLNEVFLDSVLYSNDVSLYIVDIYNNLEFIDQVDDKIVLQNSKDQDIYSFIKEKQGRYYIDFVLDYVWKLRGIVQYKHASILDLRATIELINCDVRAKVTTVNSEVISPVSLGENNSLFIGDIDNDSVDDIGFSGGFLQSEETNDKFYLKYGFSYDYAADYGGFEYDTPFCVLNVFD